jgi:hypothetical protein
MSETTAFVFGALLLALFFGILAVMLWRNARTTRSVSWRSNFRMMNR